MQGKKLCLISNGSNKSIFSDVGRYKSIALNQQHNHTGKKEQRIGGYRVSCCALKAFASAFCSTQCVHLSFFVLTSPWLSISEYGFAFYTNSFFLSICLSMCVSVFLSFTLSLCLYLSVSSAFRSPCLCLCLHHSKCIFSLFVCLSVSLSISE